MEKKWEDREVGTFLLQQFVNPGRNGAIKSLGEFKSLRAAVEAARAFAPYSTLTGDFAVDEKWGSERKGAEVQGRHYAVSLEAPKYFPDMEITLSDGRTVWVGDVDSLIRERLDAFATAHAAIHRGCTGGHTSPAHVCAATV
jgi:hypothetical protein